jgi:hypothetical protein
MGVEKERSGHIREFKIFGNNKKEGNHEPGGDRSIIDQRMEFIFRSL